MGPGVTYAEMLEGVRMKFDDPPPFMLKYKDRHAPTPLPRGGGRSSFRTAPAHVANVMQMVRLTGTQQLRVRAAPLAARRQTAPTKIHRGAFARVKRPGCPSEACAGAVRCGLCAACRGMEAHAFEP